MFINRAFFEKAKRMDTCSYRTQYFRVHRNTLISAPLSRKWLTLPRTLNQSEMSVCSRSSNIIKKSNLRWNISGNLCEYFPWANIPVNVIASSSSKYKNKPESYMHKEKRCNLSIAHGWTCNKCSISFLVVKISSSTIRVPVVGQETLRELLSSWSRWHDSSHTSVPLGANPLINLQSKPWQS